MSRHLIIVTALALGCGAVGPHGPHAQTFTGSGPVRPFRMPEAEPSRVAETGPSRVAEARPPRVAEAVGKEVAPARPALRLRHLPSHPDGPRLSGEWASRAWPLWLTEAEARSAIRLQVALTTAASVLPDRSTLTVTVNGRPLPSLPLPPPGGPPALTVELPPGSVVPGANAVRIAVEQRHRVDCSVEATYELWTEIDPAATGLVLPDGAGGVGELAEVAAARPDPQGAIPIRLVLGDRRMTEAGAGQAVAAAQALAVAGRFGQPRVDFGPPAGGDQGLNLVVGPAGTLGQAVEAAALGPVVGPRLAILARTSERRPTLVVTGRDDGEVGTAIEALAAARDAASARGAATGTRAAAEIAGRPVEGGETIALRDLGIADQEHTGRLLRLPFELRLPHDVLLADYAKVTVDLAGGYAPGLAPGAQIRIEVNGADAASLDIGKASGEVFSHKEIFFPLSRLRPGRNRLAIVVAAPHASDAVCDDAAAPARRSLVLGATQIRLPPFARIGRLPDLAPLAASAFPFGSMSERPILHVPGPDRETMGAAATLAARLAVAAGAPVPFVFAAAVPSGGAPVLTVAAARAVPAATWERTGLQPAALDRAWAGQGATVPLPSPRGRGETAIPACGERATPPVRPPAERGDLLATWSARQAEASLASRAATWLRDRFAAAVGIWGEPVPSGAPDLAGSSLVVAQAAEPRVEVLVAAPSGPALARAVDCLVEPRAWHELGGRLALLDAGTGAVRSLPVARQVYVPTGRLSVGNLRLIAAGWLSLHPGLFALAALAAAAALALTTTWLVGHVGRRQP